MRGTTQYRRVGLLVPRECSNRSRSINSTKTSKKIRKKNTATKSQRLGKKSTATTNQRTGKKSTANTGTCHQLMKTIAPALSLGHSSRQSLRSHRTLPRRTSTGNRRNTRITVIVEGRPTTGMSLLWDRRSAEGRGGNKGRLTRF